MPCALPACLHWLPAAILRHVAPLGGFTQRNVHFRVHYLITLPVPCSVPDPRLTALRTAGNFHYSIILGFIAAAARAASAPTFDDVLHRRDLPFNENVVTRVFLIPLRRVRPHFDDVVLHSLTCVCCLIF